MIVLLLKICLFAKCGLVNSFTTPSAVRIQQRGGKIRTTASKRVTGGGISNDSVALSMFNFGSGNSKGSVASIPKSNNERDNQAIDAIKAAIKKKPSGKSIPLIECEFPPLGALNKLGDGSLRSTLEAEDANIAFASKLVKGLAPFPFGPKINVFMSSAASNSYVTKAKTKIKGGQVLPLKGGVDEEVLSEKDICVMVTPSTRSDYQIAEKLASSGQVFAVIIVNAFAKDQKSIPSSATMGYFLKPLTYNSQIAGFLIRSYPSEWTVLDAFSKEVLGTFTDDEIRVKNTNTPDLRQSGKLVQSSVDQRAIRARQL